MSGHTPGPWSLETVPTTAGSCHKIGPFPSAGVRPVVHACVYADGIRLGLDEQSPVAVELLDNARLIAAAPDLLSALDRLTRAASCAAGTDFMGDEYHESIEQASKAIAKARGES
jgi:hypothetical protein